MPLQIRRGTAAEKDLLNVPLANGELLWTTDSRQLFIGDGINLARDLTAVINYSDEDAQEAVNALLSSGTHTDITYTYNDLANTLDSAVSISQFRQDVDMAGFELTGTGNVNITGNISAEQFSGVLQGSVFGDDSIQLVNADESQINLDGTVKGDVIPDITETHDLGSPSKRFKDLYLSGSSLWLGMAQVTASGTSINLPAGSTINGEPLGEIAQPGNSLQIDIIGEDSSLLIDSSNGNITANNITSTGDITATGSLTVNDGITGDFTGSVFANDSTLLLDGVDGTIPAQNLTGAATIDIIGSVFADNSTKIVDATNGTLIGSVFSSDETLLVDADANTFRSDIASTDGTRILFVGTDGSDAVFNGDVNGDTFGLHNGNVVGDLTGNVVGDLQGSVFADNSALIVDGLSGTLSGNLIGVNGSLLIDVDNNTVNTDIASTDGTRILFVGTDGSDAVYNGVVNGDTFGFHTGDMLGNVNGNVTGDLIGDVIGNVAGNLVGNVLGDVVGNVTGDIVGSVFGDDSTILVDGINKNASFVNLDASLLDTSLLRTSTIESEIETLSFTSDTGSSTFSINSDDDPGILVLNKTSSSDLSGSTAAYGRIIFSRDDINGSSFHSLIAGSDTALSFGVDDTGLFSDLSKFVTWTGTNFGVGKLNPSSALDVNGNGKFSGDVEAAAFKGSIVSDDSTIMIDAVENTITAGGFIQFGSLTSVERDDLIASNGMVIYNTTNNKFEGYQNGAWINLDDGTAAS